MDTIHQPQTATPAQSFLPDPGNMVLMRLEDEDRLVWPGYHDGECWRRADGAIVKGGARGWVSLYRARITLDMFANWGG